jgi:hypothetical protein
VNDDEPEALSDEPESSEEPEESFEDPNVYPDEEHPLPVGGAPAVWRETIKERRRREAAQAEALEEADATS